MTLEELEAKVLEMDTALTTANDTIATLTTQLDLLQSRQNQMGMLMVQLSTLPKELNRFRCFWPELPCGRSENIFAAIATIMAPQIEEIVAELAAQENPA